MKNETVTQKKAYAPPTITRHGTAVEKTLGNRYGTGEMWNPGGPPDQH